MMACSSPDTLSNWIVRPILVLHHSPRTFLRPCVRRLGLLFRMRSMMAMAAFASWRRAAQARKATWFMMREVSFFIKIAS